MSNPTKSKTRNGGNSWMWNDFQDISTGTATTVLRNGRDTSKKGSKNFKNSEELREMKHDFHERRS